MAAPEARRRVSIPLSLYHRSVVEAPLAARLRKRIASEGPIRFDEFQEAALYDPAGGYYEREGRVGKGGDFVTGASWHPAFARCLARLAETIAEETGGPPGVLDVGAGEGELLRNLAEAAPGLALAGIERSTARRSRAEAAAPRAALFESLDGSGRPVDGLVVAYELVDALPVRSLRVGEEGELIERLVGASPDGAFAWRAAPAPDGEAIAARLASRGVSLEPGQLLEVRPWAPALARRLADALGRGLLLVFDYGAPARALYGPARPGGTLEAFLSHRVTRDVLPDPGSRDITAWVDFTELEEALSAAGLEVHGLVSQSRLLLGLGLAEELAATTDPFERNALAKLVAPGGMGESIRVLVAGRGAPRAGRAAVAPLGSDRPPGRHRA